MKKNILIIGSAGFLGEALLRHLSQKDYKLTGFDRTNPFPLTLNAEYIKGDILDYQSVHKAIKAKDVVINCSGVMPNASKKEMFSLHSNGMENILKSALENTVDRIIHISSPAVYGSNDTIPWGEDAPLRGANVHAQAKIIAEQVCQKYRIKGLSVTILRPMPLTGHGRLGVFYLFYQLIEKGITIPLLGDGKNIIQLLDIGDLCNVITLLIQQDKSLINDVFNVGAERFSTLREDIQNLINTVNSKSRLCLFPAFPIKIILNILTKIGISDIYYPMIAILDKSIILSNEKIKKLGWKAVKSNTESLITGYYWYLKNKENIIETKTNRGKSSNKASRLLNILFKKASK
ncbi:MAG: NAD(P)-dependent oxidoreductase [Candidatus Omnitrophica bacterium]|nr:NAD(P)-dependent oxidoreductase [Candidatus Omnitrophota bacterium]